jgi:hypothetical protein
MKDCKMENTDEDKKEWTRTRREDSEEEMEKLGEKRPFIVNFFDELKMHPCICLHSTH